MQKKIALINDVTGFGRCSIAVMAPIVSAMKIQGSHCADGNTIYTYTVSYILL